MVYAAAVLAALLLLLAVVYADVHRHAWALRRRGLYGMEWLQYRLGLRTLQELELAVDATLRPDGLFALPRERVAALPIRWATRGFAFLLPSLIAAGALLGFLVSCVGEPNYGLLTAGGGYVAVCFAWDLWVVSWFDTQLGTHRQVLAEKQHEALVEAIGDELDQDDYPISTELQLTELLVEHERRHMNAELEDQHTSRANAPTIKLVYRLMGWAFLEYLGRQGGEIVELNAELQDLHERLARAEERTEALLRECAERLGEPLPYREPRQPPPPPRPLAQVLGTKLDALREQRLLGQASDDVDERLQRLERILAGVEARPC